MTRHLKFHFLRFSFDIFRQISFYIINKSEIFSKEENERIIQIIGRHIHQQCSFYTVDKFWHEIVFFSLF